MDGQGKNNFRKWDMENALFKYADGSECKINAGTFVYSGFGYGYYYSINGNKYWCKRSESRDMALEDGVNYLERDSLNQHHTPYLGD